MHTEINMKCRVVEDCWLCGPNVYSDPEFHAPPCDCCTHYLLYCYSVGSDCFLLELPPWHHYLYSASYQGIRKGAVFGPLGGGLRRGSAAFGQRKPQQQLWEKRERERDREREIWLGERWWRLVVVELLCGGWVCVLFMCIYVFIPLLAVIVLTDFASFESCVCRVLFNFGWLVSAMLPLFRARFRIIQRHIRWWFLLWKCLT